MFEPARFWDKVADGYSKKPVKDMESYEKTLEHTRKFLSPNDTVLEIGCGTGTTALRLAPHVKQLVASDISSRMIEIAREKAAAEGVPNIRFDRATLFDPELEEGSFDAVLAFNLLHLLEDIPAAIQRIRALLRPGGVFISKTVCLAEQSRLWRLLLSPVSALGLVPPIRCLKVVELEEMMTGAGFEIMETDLFPPSPPSRFVVARKSNTG